MEIKSDHCSRGAACRVSTGYNGSEAERAICTRDSPSFRRTQAGFFGGHAYLDFLRNLSRIGANAVAGDPAAIHTDHNAGAVSHRRPIRTFRRDDAWTLRDRVSRFERRPKLDALLVSL